MVDAFHRSCHASRASLSPRVHAVFLAFALLTGACGTTRGASQGAADSDAERPHMMGLNDEPLTDQWRDWTPSDAPPTPEALASQASAFDYWQISDRPFVEQSWSSIFAVLDAVRRELPSNADARRTTVRLLMTELEPSETRPSLDATFVVSSEAKTQPWEGLLIRVYRQLDTGGVPGVSVLYRRPEGAGSRPRQIFVWLRSGFAESPSLTLALERAASGWRMRVAEGIHLLPIEEPHSEDAALIASILVEGLWSKFTDRHYLEGEVARFDELAEPVGPFERAGGLELHDREIDQVFSDTVFTPRLTQFPGPR